ncbi:MAG: diphthamide synthesis protein [archaeon]
MKQSETSPKSSPKVLFIETRKKFNLKELDFSPLDKLPGKTISLAATIQYIELVPKVKRYLESKNKKVIIKKGAFHDAHVLGCNSNALDKNADTILLITDGKFHALNNAVQIQREIYVFSPGSQEQKSKNLEKVSKQDIEEINKRTKAKQSKFLLADVVGILVTTKSGQKFSLKNLNTIKSKIEKKGKKVYLFETNNINTQEFENFPQIQIWINTACYGLALDDPRIVNLQDVLEFL